MKPEQEESVKWSKFVPASFWGKWAVCVCCCREFISEALEAKTEEFSNTVVPLLFRQVCTVCLHNLLPNYPSAMVSPWTGTHFSMIWSLFIVRNNFESWHCLWLWLFLPVLTITPCPSPKPLAAPRIPRGVRHRDSNCSWLGRSPHHDISPKTPGRSQSPSITFSDSSLSLSQRKAKVTHCWACSILVENGRN